MSDKSVVTPQKVIEQIDASTLIKSLPTREQSDLKTSVTLPDEVWQTLERVSSDCSYSHKVAIEQAVEFASKVVPASEFTKLVEVQREKWPNGQSKRPGVRRTVALSQKSVEFIKRISETSVQNGRIENMLRDEIIETAIQLLGVAVDVHKKAVTAAYRKLRDMLSPMEDVSAEAQRILPENSPYLPRFLALAAEANELAADLDTFVSAHIK